MEDTVRPQSVEMSPRSKQEEQDLNRLEKQLRLQKLRDTLDSSCCGRDKKCSKSLLQFIMQALISILVLVFCMIQLAFDRDSDNTAVYFSLLSSLVTLYVSPPSATSTFQLDKK